jgi:beta-glucanase (GH16 family)
MQNRILCIAAVLVTGMTARYAAAQTPTAPVQLSRHRLVFDDEFDPLNLSTNGYGRHTWYPNLWFNHYPPPLGNIFASQSQLSLVWSGNQVSTDTSVTTTSWNASHFRAIRYGYFEARMRWDVVNGAWPAFWLLPVEDITGEDIVNGVRESGEIDIFEGQGNQPTTFFGTIHDWVNAVDVRSSAGRNSFPLPVGTDLSEFHTYGLLWTPGQVTWFFDNVPLHTEATYPIMEKQNYYVILGMQEGAGWTHGNLNGVSATNMTLNVNWLRIWAVPDTPVPGLR